MGLVDQARWGAYSSQVFPKGLDLNRCIIPMDPGTFRANPSASFRAGSIVTRENPTGLVNIATGSDCFGVSKWNKGSGSTTIIVDQAIVLNGTTATALQLGILAGQTISNVAVRSAPDMGGTLYSGSTDYTAVLSGSGPPSIARIGGTTISDGATVYVTFQVPLNTAALNVDGREFHMDGVDDVGNQDDFCTVIIGASVLFTMEWVARTYALSGANMNLYCSGAGQFTNDTTGSPDFLGHVFQLPRADDRYMGVRLGGIPVA